MAGNFFSDLKTSNRTITGTETIRRRLLRLLQCRIKILKGNFLRSSNNKCLKKSFEGTKGLKLMFEELIKF